jgi:NDP-sugar pyrophosphorylase family protein
MLHHKLLTQSSAPEDGRNYRPKQLIEIINKPLLLHLVGYLYYWQMGFNSVFKG